MSFFVSLFLLSSRERDWRVQRNNSLYILQPPEQYSSAGTLPDAAGSFLNIYFYYYKKKKRKAMNNEMKRHPRICSYF
jgi:hypothetical protein